MAVRQNLARAFNNNSELQQFVLTDVTSTHKCLGSGSFGSVQEVMYKSLICAGKKLNIEDDDGDTILEKYMKESKLLSSSCHINIIQFYGLCLLPNDILPMIVMEKLDICLHEFLLKTDKHLLSLNRKCSILEDVARGLLYLHNREPPIVHRDLTAKNILLGSPLIAKISDMGNARIMDPGKTAMTLSKTPGTKVYMPPEAMDSIHCSYGPSLDVFSYGHLALYVFTQEFPCDLLPSTYCDSDNHDIICARSEMDRRKKYMKLLEDITRPAEINLADLVKSCLYNAPDKRIRSSELLVEVQRIKAAVDKDTSPERDLQSQDVQLNKMQCEIRQLRDELQVYKATPALRLNERSGPDMPFPMGNYVQSVVIEGAVYIGGGDATDNVRRKDYTVIKYCFYTKKWDQIKCPVCFFTIVAINNQLVRIGGYKDGKRSKEVRVWIAESKRWKDYYPSMSEARSRCSAVVSNGWLVVAGGWSRVEEGHPLSSVEVMNIADKHWLNGPRAPSEWVGMRAACLDGTCYFMGGYISREGKAIASNKVYSAQLEALVSGTDSWTEIPSLPFKYCSPLSFGGSLMAIGGEVKKGEESSLIQIYNSDSQRWIEVGKLQSPRSKCSCALLEDGRIVVAGGNHQNASFLDTMEIHVLAPFTQWHGST